MKAVSESEGDEVGTGWIANKIEGDASSDQLGARDVSQWWKSLAAEQIREAIRVDVPERVRVKREREATKGGLQEGLRERVPTKN
jgi:hypothetical protein